MISYKDTLEGAEFGAYEEMVQEEEEEEENQVSEDEIESESARDETDVEGNICIKLTKEEKLRIKKKWSNSHSQSF